MFVPTQLGPNGISRFRIRFPFRSYFSYYFVLLYLLAIQDFAISESNNSTQNLISDSLLEEDAITATIYECHQEKSSPRVFNKDLKRVKELIVERELSFGNISRTFSLSRNKDFLLCKESSSVLNEYVNYKVRRTQVNLNHENTQKRPVLSFFPTGQLRHFRDDYTVAVIYNPNEYCIQRFNESHMEVQICTSNCGQKKKGEEICINKCCPPGYVMDFDNHSDIDYLSCAPSGNNRWIPTFFDSKAVSSGQPFSLDQNITIPYRTLNRIGQWCQDFNLYLGIPRIENDEEQPGYSWRLLENGKIAIHNPKRNPLKLDTKWDILEQTFCMDGIQNFGQDQYYVSHHDHQLVMACRDELGEGINTYIYITAFYVSLIPLGFTIFAYWITWDAQNIHGWTVLSHIVALFLMNLFFGTSFSASFAITHESFNEGSWGRVSCVLLGIFTHFFFLSTYCWLTMVNFDLWCTFRNLKQTIKKSKGFSRFLIYAGISWGGPLIVIIVGLSLQEQYGKDGGDRHIILPNYGTTRCYLEPEAQGVYIYSVLGILSLGNLGFFSATVYALYNYRRTTQLAVRGKSTQEMTSGELFIKLFVVMGVTLILEFISWAVESDYNVKDVPWIWVAIDVINITVRAVLIFIIFACKRQTLVKLKAITKDYPCCSCLALIFPEPESAMSSQVSAIKMSSVNSNP